MMNEKPVIIPFDVQEAKARLNPLQRKKLQVAAQILKLTADLYDGTSSVLPLWAAGVITHGQPKSNKYVIGTTAAAKNAATKDTAIDHLFRVTATAEIILTRAKNLSVEDIEDILLQRSITMRTTRAENNNQLKKALKNCANKDDWQELYRVAGVRFTLDPAWVK